VDLFVIGARLARISSFYPLLIRLNGPPPDAVAQLPAASVALSFRPAAPARQQPDTGHEFPLVDQRGRK